MAQNIDICITAKDNYTDVLTKMRNTQAAFRKDLEGTQKKLDAFNRNKATLKIDVEKAKKELKAAEKNVEGLSDELKEQNIILKQMEYETAVDNLRAVEKAARDTRKEMNKMTDSFESSSKKVESGSINKKGTFSMAKDFLAVQGVTELTSQIGGAIEAVAMHGISSTFGESAGTMAGSVLGGVISGAASGAAIGSVVPGIGTAVGATAGAGLGAASGYLMGQVQIVEKKDGYFREEVEGVLNDTEAFFGDNLTAGKTTASEREAMGISFRTILGDDAGNELLNEIHDFAGRTPFEYNDLANTARTLLAYNVNSEDIIPMMEGLGNAGSALGKSADDIMAMATYFGRIKSTGKVNLEYINPLLERGIDVYELYAKAKGISRESAMSQISGGNVNGAEFFDLVINQMNETYAGGMEKMSQTAAGLASTLDDINADLQAAMGQGYNDAMALHQKDWIDNTYTDENMGRLENAYKELGAYQASIDAKKQDIINQHLINAAERIEERGLSGQEAQKIMQEAYADAIVEWKNTEEYQNKVKDQMELIGDIQDDVRKGTSHILQYELGEKKGQGAEVGIKSFTQFAGSGSILWLAHNAGWLDGFGNAYGLSYVPYNDYPAYLHEGERVLTASENRAYSQSRQGSVVITGNSFTVREEADITKIATQLYEKISEAKVGYVA